MLQCGCLRSLFGSVDGRPSGRIWAASTSSTLLPLVGRWAWTSSDFWIIGALSQHVEAGEEWSVEGLMGNTMSASEWKGCGKTNLSKWIEQVFRTIISRSSAFLGTVDRASGAYLATYISRSPPNPCAWGASASKMIARRAAWGSPGKKVKTFNVEPIISGITRKSSENSRPKVFRVFLSQ